MPTRAALLVYLVIDVSGSTWDNDPKNPGQSRRPLEETAWEAARAGITDLWYVLRNEPTARDIVHLRVIEFGDSAKDLLPRTRIRDMKSIPKLGRQMQTNFQAAFAHVANRLESDLKELAGQYDELRQPIIYFMTDGMPYVGRAAQPESAWLPELERIHRTATPAASRRARVGTDGQSTAHTRGHHPAVVAIGFDEVDERTLVRISRRPGVACLAEAGLASPGELLSEVLLSVLDSIIHSASSQFTFRPPAQMRLLR